MNNDILKEELEKFEPFNEQELNDKIAMLTFINSFDDVLTRNNILGHFTGSAFVVNEDFTKTLLVHHNILKGFIYPGGHADGETNLLGVAVREVEEETVLKVKPYTKDLFAIMAIPTPGHFKKGKYVSAHTHFDFLYLVMAKNEDMNKIRVLPSENSEIKWVNLDDSYKEDVVSFIRPNNEKIVKRIRTLK